MGKTTLLNCLAASIPSRERVVTCEEVFELKIPLRDVASMQCRQPSLEGTGEVPLRRLVKEALRMRPSRIIVGEVRQAESLDLLIALNSGVPVAYADLADQWRLVGRLPSGLWSVVACLESMFDDGTDAAAGHRCPVGAGLFRILARGRCQPRTWCCGRGRVTGRTHHVNRCPPRVRIICQYHAVTDRECPDVAITVVYLADGVNNNARWQRQEPLPGSLGSDVPEPTVSRAA